MYEGSLGGGLLLCMKGRWVGALTLYEGSLGGGLLLCMKGRWVGVSYLHVDPDVSL